MSETSPGAAFPRWHFGVHQLRSAGSSPRDIVRTIRRTRDRRIPMDALLLDGFGEGAASWSERTRRRVAEDLGDLRVRTVGLADAEQALPASRIGHDCSVTPLAELLSHVSAAPTNSLVEFSASGADDSLAVLRALECAFLLPMVALRLPFGPAGREFWDLAREEEERVRRLLELRMELLPYLETSLHRSLTGGAPLVSQPQAADGDAWMIGDSLVIAPQADVQATSRSLALPAGEWYHYWTGRRYGGDHPITVEAGHGTPPLFFRAGSVLPSEPVRQHTGEVVPAVTFLDVYSGDALDGELTDCDENGRAAARTTFRGELDYGSMQLEIDGSPEAQRPDLRMMWSVRVHGLGGSVRSVLVDGAPVEAGAGSRVLEFSFRATGARQMLEVEFDEY